MGASLPQCPGDLFSIGRLAISISSLSVVIAACQASLQGVLSYPIYLQLLTPNVRFTGIFSADGPVKSRKRMHCVRRICAVHRGFIAMSGRYAHPAPFSTSPIINLRTSADPPTPPAPHSQKPSPNCRRFAPFVIIDSLQAGKADRSTGIRPLDSPEPLLEGKSRPRGATPSRRDVKATPDFPQEDARFFANHPHSIHNHAIITRNPLPTSPSPPTCQAQKVPIRTKQSTSTLPVFSRFLS